MLILVQKENEQDQFHIFQDTYSESFYTSASDNVSVRKYKS